MVGTDPFSGRFPKISSVNDIHRQLGEIVATNRATDERLREVKETLEQISDNAREAKEAAHVTENTLKARITALEHQSAHHHEMNTRRLDSMAADLAALKTPVDQFVSLKKKVGMFLLVLTSIGSVLWMVAAPVWNVMVSRFMDGPARP